MAAHGWSAVGVLAAGQAGYECGAHGVLAPAGLRAKIARAGYVRSMSKLIPRVGMELELVDLDARIIIGSGTTCQRAVAGGCQ